MVVLLFFNVENRLRHLLAPLKHVIIFTYFVYFKITPNQDRSKWSFMTAFSVVVFFVVVVVFNETVFHFQFFVDKRSPDVKDGSESETRSL